MKAIFFSVFLVFLNVALGQEMPGTPKFSPIHEHNSMEAQLKASMLDRTPLKPTGPLGAEMIGKFPERNKALECKVEQVFISTGCHPQAPGQEVKPPKKEHPAHPIHPDTPGADKGKKLGLVEPKTNSKPQAFVPPQAGSALNPENTTTVEYSGGKVITKTYDLKGNVVATEKTRTQTPAEYETAASLEFIRRGAQFDKTTNLNSAEINVNSPIAKNNPNRAEFWLRVDVTTAYCNGLLSTAYKQNGMEYEPVNVQGTVDAKAKANTKKQALIAVTTTLPDGSDKIICNGVIQGLTDICGGNYLKTATGGISIFTTQQNAEVFAKCFDKPEEHGVALKGITASKPSLLP